MQSQWYYNILPSFVDLINIIDYFEINNKQGVICKSRLLHFFSCFVNLVVTLFLLIFVHTLFHENLEAVFRRYLFSWFQEKTLYISRFNFTVLPLLKSLKSWSKDFVTLITKLMTVLKRFWGPMRQLGARGQVKMTKEI